MMDEREATQTFTAFCETIQLDEATLHLEYTQTIVPAGPRAESQRWLDSLPTLSLGAQQRGRFELEVGQTLGCGGMGIVYLARQWTLGREVAVKCLQEAHRSPEGIHKLLQEARITGMLEHPNIVPLHLLGKNSEGDPILVMKRIEGVCWREILQGEARPPSSSRRFERDPLAWHLGVLLEVCNAVHFAHSRGIIHRDIKPENVMIGSFGEVYLLDWGLALSLRDNAEGALPLARESRDIAGTPAYMAPEMTMNDDAAPLSEATDVYLLGAVLHEVMTRRTRHGGETIFAVLFQAYRSEPYDYGEEIPPELGAICNRACHVEPSLRFESAAALQEALEDYLRHRTSIELARETSVRLQELQERVAQEEEGQVEEREECPEATEQSASIYRLYNECRFGFEQALRSWPEGRLAREGLSEATKQLLRHEIKQKNRSAVQSLRAELEEQEELSPEWQQRLKEFEAELAREEEEQRALEAMAYEYDPTVSSTPRIILFVALALFIGIFAFFGITLNIQGESPVTPLKAAGAPLFILIVLTGVGLRWRHLFFKNTFNRKVFFMLFLAFVVMGITRLLGTGLGLSMREVLIWDVFHFAIFAAAAAILVHPLGWFHCLLALSATLLSVFFREQTYWIMGGGVFLGLLSLVLPLLRWFKQRSSVSG